MVRVMMIMVMKILLPAVEVTTMTVDVFCPGQAWSSEDPKGQ